MQTHKTLSSLDGVTGTSYIEFYIAENLKAKFSYAHATQWIIIHERLIPLVISRYDMKNFIRDAERFSGNTNAVFAPLVYPDIRYSKFTVEYKKSLGPDKIEFTGKIKDLLGVDREFSGEFEATTDLLTLDSRPELNINWIDFLHFLEIHRNFLRYCDEMKGK